MNIKALLATCLVATFLVTPLKAQSADENETIQNFREFVSVNQALLNILIGKAGLFNTVPFIGQPMTAVLRQVEGATDYIAPLIIDQPCLKSFWVGRLQNLIAKAQALQPIAQTINIINGPLILIGQGPLPQIIDGYQDIVQTMNAYASAFQSQQSGEICPGDTGTAAGILTDEARSLDNTLELAIRTYDGLSV